MYICIYVYHIYISLSLCIGIPRGHPVRAQQGPIMLVTIMILIVQVVLVVVVVVVVVVEVVNITINMTIYNYTM